MNRWIRRSHRWVSIVFTLTVIANFVAMAAAPGQMPPPWITYSPLLPLAILMCSGLYLFALPFLGRSPSARAMVTAHGAAHTAGAPTAQG